MAIEGFRRKKKRLGDLLVAARVVTEEQLKDALEQQKISKNKLGEVLTDMGYVTEYQIAKALHIQLDYDIVNLSEIKIPDELINLVEDKVLRKHMVIPFGYKDGNPSIINLAMANPLDFIALDDLSIITDRMMNPFVATTTDVLKAIDKYYGNKEAMAVAEQYTKEKESQYKEEDADTSNLEVENAPIVLLVKTIIEQAVRQRASDIHIEPMENRVRVRYRIDGVLMETMQYKMNLFAAIVARIKIIGGMDISEKRKPQDGRITQIVDRTEYDIRVSVLPTVFGEKIVMRLTAKKALNRKKSELGFSQQELVEFNQILAHPHGIILVTGPTGSGKSTTLYTALSELNNEDVNIITVEDPVEANIDGINQVQTNTKAGLTFASALRSILRQDPDIIMIGEIRDTETAQIAVKAAITGHLVVSTLHTNSAASSIARLEDMEVEPYLIADSTVGIIAQRLLRRLCPNCKKKVRATDFDKELLKVPLDQELTIFEPGGCASCGETGYFGRIGIYEIMTITPKLKKMINEHRSADDLEAEAIKEGMHTLRMSAGRCVMEGISSLSEMKRVTFE